MREPERSDQRAKELLDAAHPGGESHRWNAEFRGDDVYFCRGHHSGDCRDEDWELLCRDEAVGLARRAGFRRPLTRFRWTIAPTHTRHGSWRDTAKEAREDALEAGLASRDEHRDAIYLDELVEVEEERC